MISLLGKFVAFALFLLDYLIAFVLTLIKGNSWKPIDLRSKRKVVGTQISNPKRRPNETNPYRHVTTANGKLVETPFEGMCTVNEIFKEACRRNSSKKCMGVRRLLDIETSTIKKPDGTEGKWQTFVFENEITWETYERIDKRIQHIASGIVQFTGLNSEDRIGIFANTSQEWMLTAQAALRYNITIVSVYASLGEDALVHCLNEGEVATLLVDEELLGKLEKVAKQVKTLSHIIYIPQKKESNKQASDSLTEKTKLRVKSLSEVEEMGRTSSRDATAKKPSTGESIALIMYTSGTTGIPKGVVIKHKAIVAAIAAGDTTLNLDYSKEQTYLAYLPLAHILEFIAEHIMLCNGCAVGYGNPRTLVDRAAKPYGDITAVRPTLMAGVPRVFDTIKKGIIDLIESPKTNPIVRFLFKTAYEQKKAALYAGRGTPLWDLLVFNKIRKQMGGRVEVIAAGGAALGKETHEFIRIITNASICQGYGLTESCAMLSVPSCRDPFLTKVTGGPVRSVEVKLVSVPDMGYYVDDPKGPKGEICVRGTSMSSGYYKQPEKTAEVFKEDGWFETGDIGTFDEYGVLSIIDRKKNLVKLDHGEYVALEKIETIYNNSPYVSPNGVCCYADSSVSFVSALILPQVAQIKRFAEQHGITGSLADIYKNEKVVAEVLSSLKNEAKKANLQGSEIIQKLTLLDAEWTPENDCLTAAMKLKRSTIAKRHEAEIKAMYGKK